MMTFRERAIVALEQSDNFAVDWQGVGRRFITSAHETGNFAAAFEDLLRVFAETRRAPVRLTVVVKRDADGLIGATRDFSLTQSDVLLAVIGSGRVMADALTTVAGELTVKQRVPA